MRLERFEVIQSWIFDGREGSGFGGNEQKVARMVEFEIPDLKERGKYSSS